MDNIKNSFTENGAFEKEENLRLYGLRIIWENDLIMETKIRLVPSDKEEEEKCDKCRTTDFNSCHSMHCPIRKEKENSTKLLAALSTLSVREETKESSEEGKERIDKMIEEISLLQKANDGLRTQINLEAFRNSDLTKIKSDLLKLQQRHNASTKAYSELKQQFEGLKTWSNKQSIFVDKLSQENEINKVKFFNEGIEKALKIIETRNLVDFKTPIDFKYEVIDEIEKLKKY